MRNFKCLSAPTSLFFSALSSRLLCCVRGVKFLCLFVAFVLAGCCQFVFADNFSWYYNSPSTGGYSSAKAACDAFISATSKPKGTPNSKYMFDQYISMRSPTHAYCYYKYVQSFSDGSHDSTAVYIQYNGNIFRTGDSCPTGATYNPNTGGCEAPEPDQCEPEAGKDVFHEHLAGQTSGATGSEPPGSICENSCQYAYSHEPPPPQGCYRKGGQEKEGIFCKFKYKANGISCTSDNPPADSPFDQPPTKPPIDPKPERAHEQKCDNWVTGVDGIARRTCTSKDSFNDPGGLDCAKTNGYLSCSPGPKPPAHTEKNTETETAKTDNPDGSSKTETTTKDKLTNCHGAKKCTESNTEKKETENSNADGSPGDKTTTCTGDKCTTDKEPELGTDPDAEEEGDEEKSSVSGGATCDSPPVCEGDAIQCAILRQEFTQRCADEKFREVTPENTNALKTDLEGAFSGDQYKPITADAENTYSLEGMIDTSSRFSSSCPTIPSVSYKWVDGSSQSFDPNFPGLCEYLRWMGFLLVAFAMRAAAEIIAGGLK